MSASYPQQFLANPKRYDVLIINASFSTALISSQRPLVQESKFLKHTNSFIIVTLVLKINGLCLSYGHNYYSMTFKIKRRRKFSIPKLFISKVVS